MGGDKDFFLNASIGRGSSSEPEFLEQTSDLLNIQSEHVSSSNVQNGSEDRAIEVESLEFSEAGYGISPNSLRLKADQMRARNIHAEIFTSYNELPRRSIDLKEPVSRILRYRPGSWIEKVGGLKQDDYHLPETTTILLIGPEGSGKSSLINRITKVLEDDMFASARAQVSFKSPNYSSAGDGTHLLQEYMVPRASNAFCVYDTRSLSENMYENMKVLKDWITKGVRHGELVERSSDNACVKSIMKYKASQIGHGNGKVRMVNFVVMVVNGLSVLESMDSGDAEKKQYTEIVADVFKNPFLSFKDDKPVVVVTHGDLLTIPDRVRLRIHLGEMLGIPPKTQIFDIPESNDLTTKLTIIKLLLHCLEHADRNLPLKRCRFWVKMGTYFLLFVVLAIVFAPHNRPPPDVNIDWSSIRHLWSGED